MRPMSDDIAIVEGNNELNVELIPTGVGFYWLLPTGHNDPSGRWDDAELAYDGWTDTRAEITGVGTKSWSPFIELTIEPTEISAVRYWSSSPVSPDTVDIDLYYEGAWHHVYEGGKGSGWNEHTIPEGIKVVTKARFRQYNPSGLMRMRFRLHEFQFYGYAEEPPPLPPPPPPPVTTKLFGRVTDRTTGAPIVGVIGTVYQDYDTHTEDYDFTTDAQGYYLIDNMLFEVDVTMMVIYAEGYQTYTKERISISEGDNELNVRMSPY